MNIFFISNYEKLQLYNKCISRSKEKYIYFLYLNTKELSNNTSSILIFKQITQSFLLQYTVVASIIRFSNCLNFCNRV